jgi:hypothetical protein
MIDETITLYRPIGPEELDLVRRSGFKEWPPRLAGQPIFYPVTNEAYAKEIATRWNVKEKGVGYVTRFRVRKAFRDRYEIHALKNKTVVESSGIACGRVNPGVFWTHNDSGDKPRLYAFNAKIVLTYGNAFEYARQSDESWPAAFARKGREIRMPRRQQGEAVCYGPDGRTLYLTSEGSPCPFWEVPVVE